MFALSAETKLEIVSYRRRPAMDSTPISKPTGFGSRNSSSGQTCPKTQRLISGSVPRPGDENSPNNAKVSFLNCLRILRCIR